jgi:hypothetical protein
MFGALVGSVLLPLVASADSGHGHEAESAPESGHHEGQRGHGAAAPHADSLAGVWKGLTAARDAIASDIENGTLDGIHEKSEPLPALIAALIEQSGELDAGKRSRVEGAAKQITRIAGALHEAADGGDLAKTRKELSRLDSLLKLIRAQYPAGALDEDEHGEHGP